MFTKPDPMALNAIKAVVGPAGLKEPQNAPRYFEDPRGRFQGRGSLVVLPRSTAQVAEVVRLCNEHRISVVPYSGGTGVVAGQLSIDSDAALILSLEKLNAIRGVSTDDAVMTAEAGCILENVHSAAIAHGMIFPLSMASKGSCCIGGNLATNAGGIQVLRYGSARDLCLGIEAVLPDGTILEELNPLPKNNTGYDLRHLLIGSEGTLGIITAASLKLRPLDPEAVTAMLAIRSPAQALAVYREMRTHLGETISAFELMSGFGLELVASRFTHLRRPFAKLPPWAVLVEMTGPPGTEERVSAALEACLEREFVQDAVIAQSDAQRQGLWDLREYTPEANRLSGAFCNSDTSVAVSKIDAFIAATDQAVSTLHPGLRINSYGHVGDGNIHHNVFPPKGIGKPEFLQSTPGIIDAVRMAINDVTHALGGSISAEHGIGRLKADDLQHYAGAARQMMLRQIKSAIDPNNIMNPGVLLR